MSKTIKYYKVNKLNDEEFRRVVGKSDESLSRKQERNVLMSI